MTEYHRQLFEIKTKLMTHQQYAMQLLRKHILHQPKVCPHCGILDHKNMHHTDHCGVHTFLCTACSNTYSELTGTIFFRSKIPLSKWCLALLTWVNTTDSASSCPHCSWSCYLPCSCLASLNETTNILCSPNIPRLASRWFTWSRWSLL